MKPTSRRNCYRGLYTVISGMLVRLFRVLPIAISIRVFALGSGRRGTWFIEDMLRHRTFFRKRNLTRGKLPASNGGVEAGFVHGISAGNVTCGVVHWRARYRIAMVGLGVGKASK